MPCKVILWIYDCQNNSGFNLTTMLFMTNNSVPCEHDTWRGSVVKPGVRKQKHTARRQSELGETYSACRPDCGDKERRPCWEILSPQYYWWGAWGQRLPTESRDGGLLMAPTLPGEPVKAFRFTQEVSSRRHQTPRGLTAKRRMFGVTIS